LEAQRTYLSPIAPLYLYPCLSILLSNSLAQTKQITVASDKLATLREPVLLLSLAIQGQDGKVQDINLELPASDLDKLLASLNGASDVVKQLKQL